MATGVWRAIARLVLVALLVGLALTGWFRGDPSGRATAWSAPLASATTAPTVYRVTNPNSTTLDVEHAIWDQHGFRYTFWSQVPPGQAVEYRLADMPQVPSPFAGSVTLSANLPFSAEIVASGTPSPGSTATPTPAATPTRTPSAVMSSTPFPTNTATPASAAPPAATPTGTPAVAPTITPAASMAQTWYFAEGYTGPGFDEYLTIMNPNSADAAVTLTYYLSDGTIQTKQLTVGATSRRTVAVHDATEGVGRGKSVSAKVTTTHPGGIVVERPMYFTYGDGITGGHNALGATAPSRTWYFAEGYTGTGFDEYLTIMNPNSSSAAITITYYLSDGTTQTKQVTVGPTSRYTLAVHDATEGVGRGKSVSAKVTTTHPGGIVVERPMYFTYGDGITGGHNALGATAPSRTWYFAEGYTGPGFDEYLTIMNPNSTDAAVTLTYYLSDGTTQTKQVTVGATSRSTVAVHDPAAGVGRNREVAAQVTTTHPGGIVVERPMYFTYNGAITGGHNALGTTAPSRTWYFAEGYTGPGFDEYLTIMNPNSTDAAVTLTYYLSDGTTQTKQVTVGATSRSTVAVHDPAAGVGRNREVAAQVTTTHPGGIVVERPMYFTYNGAITGGHNVIGFAR